MIAAIDAGISLWQASAESPEKAWNNSLSEMSEHINTFIIKSVFDQLSAMNLTHNKFADFKM